MSEVKWIKITTNMFEDEKIDFIQSLPEADAILVIWIRLLTLAGKCNAGGYIYLTENIPYTSDMLAHKFRKPINIVNLALDTFRKLQMIEADERGLFLLSWDKHQNIDGLDKIREQTKLRTQKYRERLKLTDGDVTSDVTVTESDAIDIDIDKEKDIYIVQSEKLWSLYPNKKGKGSAITKIPKLIREFGYEQIEKCIERYVLEIEEKKIQQQYIKHGSTFFNKGYVDYLDGNYEQTEEMAATKGNWWDSIDS